MIFDVETALKHHQLLNRHFKYNDSLSCDEKEYYCQMENIIRLELEMMVKNNRNNEYNSILTMYMKNRIIKCFVRDVFHNRDLLTKNTVTLAWNTGNINVLQSCVSFGVELHPQKNISGVIRSNSTHAVDMCIQLGASLELPLLPYRYCRSIDMVRHISKEYGCMLHNMTRKLHGNHLVSIEYIYMGGYIEEMGDMNHLIQKRGNYDRSLPIKIAYIRSTCSNIDTSNYQGIGKFILLPGFVVKNITSYI